MAAAAAVEANIKLEASEVQKFYEDAHIFITGGSGFLGQLLIQKLIRDCPDISKIYLLIRPKKGKTAEQRCEEMFQDPVFERMKSKRANYKEKIKLLSGDMEQPDLGLNEADRKLITDQVNIIFHVAATVRFDEKLKKATAINVRATKDMIKLAKTITKLKVFVHVSTAYSHCYRREIGEQFYDVPITPGRLMQITDVLNDDELAVLTPKLMELRGWPNTYTFTKALAENIIEEYGKGLPIAIVRPSIVISTHKDPVESWINNLYGPVGLSVAVGLGLVHVIQTQPDGTPDLVPADYVINATIAAGCHVGSSFNNNSNTDQESNIVFDELISSNETPIFNMTTNNENLLTWNEYHSLTVNGKAWATEHSVWQSFVIFTPYRYVRQFFHILLHLIPAYIIDMGSFLCGQKPRLVKMYEKIVHHQKSVRFFSMNIWRFESDKTQALWKNLNSTDRRLFPFSMEELDWKELLDGFGRGARIYLLKDPLETLPKGLAKHRKLKIAHYCVVAVLSFFILTVVYRIFQVLF